MSNASFQLLDNLVSHLQRQLQLDLTRMQAITHDLFFLDHANIAYSHIFRHIWSSQTASNLIEAFANKGTTKGLIYILRAIFGSDVTIHITSNPNEVGLAISNTTQEANIGLAYEESLMQALTSDTNLAILDLTTLQLGSIETLILNFLPAGVKLISLNIS